MGKFEEWLVAHKNQINAAAYGLFEDSLRCMKFDIVRPAYLMAYQGIIRHIRDVIVFGERPIRRIESTNVLNAFQVGRDLGQILQL